MNFTPSKPFIDYLEAAGYSVLKLTLSKKPFEVMIIGEKDEEYRKPSKWIMSRLRMYDYVLFTNGYGANFPWFITEFENWGYSPDLQTAYYSNGLIVQIGVDDIIISLGDVVANYKGLNNLEEKINKFASNETKAS